MFFGSFCHYLWFLHGSTLEYLGVPGSTWKYFCYSVFLSVEYLGVLGRAWEYLGVPRSTWEYHLRISPADFIHKVYQKFTLVWLCLRVIDFDWNLWWHKWHLNFITQILAFFKEIKTIFKNQQISANYHFKALHF